MIETQLLQLNKTSEATTTIKKIRNIKTDSLTVFANAVRLLISPLYKTSALE